MDIPMSCPNCGKRASTPQGFTTQTSRSKSRSNARVAVGAFEFRLHMIFSCPTGKEATAFKQ